MQLAADTAATPMNVAALLILEAYPFDLDRARAALAERVARVPRLRRRMAAVPLGCGRPIWMDHPGFDIRDHVRAIVCPPPGDERALLDLTAVLLTRRLPWDRPLWSATFVTGLEEGRVGLLVVMHHVLADGIGVLAALGALLDGNAVAGSSHAAAPAPTRRELLQEAWSERRHTLTEMVARVRRMRQAMAELRPRQMVSAVRCSLNQPTGPHRRFAIARGDLDGLHLAGRSHGATVNDVVLTAVAGALHVLLASRGEAVDTLVASVPVTARTGTTPDDLGNHVGAMVVALPAGEPDPIGRLERIAAQTARRRHADRGASAALLEPVFRALAALGLYPWLTNHQRLVNTFVTNLKGPSRPVTFLDVGVLEVIPLTSLSGNVSVSFAVLSYAGRLVVAIVADPDLCPELDRLAEELQRELDVIGAG